MKFSNLEQKIQNVKKIDGQVNSANRIKAMATNGIVKVQNSVPHVINAHGRFYGLRSKYDGNGNLRTPVKANM